MDIGSPNNFLILNEADEWLKGLLNDSLLNPYKDKGYDEISTKVFDQFLLCIEYLLVMSPVAIQDYLEKLIIERENCGLKIVAQDQRDYYIKIYNKRAIKIVEDFNNRLPFNIKFYFFLNGPRKNEIEINISQIKNCFKDWYKEFGITTPPNETSESIGEDNVMIDLESIKPKILVLRELGIIELLNNKFNSNNSHVAECIGVLINVKPSSIRGILSNLTGQKNNNTNPENIRSLENAIIVLNN